MNTTKDCISLSYPVFILSNLLHLKPFCTFALSHLSCDLLITKTKKKQKSVKDKVNKDFYMSSEKLFISYCSGVSGF